jgi:hypothetical protein
MLLQQRFDIYSKYSASTSAAVIELDELMCQLSITWSAHAAIAAIVAVEFRKRI